MKKSPPSYSPRQGSKIAEAMDALRLRPMTARELARILERDSSAINTLLLRALNHGAIIRVRDPHGRLHFALGDTELQSQFTLAEEEQTNSSNTSSEGAAQQNSQYMHTPSSDAVGSPDMQPLPFHERENMHPELQMNHRQSATASDSPPVIAGLFADGELTISIGGECLQLNTTQRQQLYAYLHKIRYLE
ncbi:hypothetical protein D3C72_199680 [compost metagenome]